MDISRRGMFGFLPGIGAAVLAGSKATMAVAAPVEVEAPKGAAVTSFNWAKMELLRRGLIGEVGNGVYESWFQSLEVERLEAGMLTVSVPVLFLKKWISTHYMVELLRASQRADTSVECVDIIVRKARTVQPNTI